MSRRWWLAVDGVLVGANGCNLADYSVAGRGGRGMRSAFEMTKGRSKWADDEARRAVLIGWVGG